MRIGRIEADGRTSFCEAGEGGVWLLAGEIGSAFSREGTWLPDGTFRVLSPVRPGKVLVVLGAFPRGVSREEARGTPPRFAAKLPSTVIADGDEVVVPAELGSTVTVEPEIAVVVGARLRRAAPAEAFAGILGFTCCNDVTLLELLRQHNDMLRAKSIDTFAPLGPWIETGLDEHDVAAGLEIQASVNGVAVHRGTTREFTHTVAEVVSEASRLHTLEPGDVISLGTPLDPATATVGDSVTVEVERVGRLTNPVRADDAGPPGPSPPGARR